MEDEINPETLISLVEERIVLWDKTSEEYKKKDLKIVAWREICSILKPDFVNLSAREKKDFGKLVANKWGNIRDAFFRAEKKEEKRRRSGAKSIRPYIYKQQLTFLAKIKELGNTYDSSPTHQDHAPTPSAAPQPMSTPKPSAPPDNKKSKLHLDSKVHEDTKEDSPHLSFFKAILPSIIIFNEDETLELQADILETIRRIRKRRQENANVTKAQASVEDTTQAETENEQSIRIKNESTRMW